MELLSETNRDGITLQEYMEELKNYKDIAFKRGAMQFEDFNYQFYNKYIILIDPEYDIN